MSRDIIAAAKRLKDAGVGEILMIAQHDWDMIREVAAVAFAYAPRPKFANVSCSHCGKSFGPGDHGFSHCDSHAGLTAIRE